MKYLIFGHAGKIVALVRAGAPLDQCFREAAQLSLEHCVGVEFEFSGKTYLTRYHDLLKCSREVIEASQDD